MVDVLVAEADHRFVHKKVRVQQLTDMWHISKGGQPSSLNWSQVVDAYNSKL